MSLTGPQVQELHTILVAAYNAETLALMVRIRLEVDLPAVADGSHFSDEVFDLIYWAERTDRTNKLIEGALADNPNNEDLERFADRYRQSCDAQSSSIVGVQDQPVASNDRGVADRASQIHTHGGAYIASSLTTAGGDFVGRDKVVQGDETNVGDINNSIAVAAGTGATAAVTVQQIFSESDLRDQNNRRVLREMVKEYWIKGLLENSLEHEAAIRLGMTEKSGMVENRPWRVIPVYDEDERLLPPGTAIVDVFDQMNQRMLILGEPGSGKTTMLLELARELIKRSSETLALPTPVVFNLSSWIQHRASLADWLVEELGIRYSIPKKMAQDWLEQGKLLLLLDGLDEVKSEYRSDCVEAINEFLLDHFIPLSVCSRVAEYKELRVRLRLHGAVLLQPLTADQIDEYLNQAGPALSAICTALKQDSELAELAESPLMLSIMALAYQGLSPAELTLNNTAPTRRYHLLDAYIQRMFVRRETKPIYSPHQTARWLQWLSGRLVQYGHTVFLIERMQPNWMLSGGEQLAAPYLMLLAGPILGLSFGLGFSFIFQVFFWLLVEQIAQPFFGLDGEFRIRFRDGIAVGLTAGVLAGLFDMVSGGFKRIEPIDQTTRKGYRLRSSLYSTLFWWVCGWLAFALQYEAASGSMHGLASGLFIGLFWGLAGGLVGGYIQVEPARHLSWSRQALKTRLWFGLRFGLQCGLVWLVIFVMFDAFGGEWTAGLKTWLIVWSAFGIIWGLAFQPAEETNEPLIMETRSPNQGIRSSAKYAAIFGLGGGLCVWMASGVIFGLDRGPRSGLSIGLIYGMIFGILYGLVFGLLGGGMVVMKHGILRLVLWWQGHIPFDYARFLDDAVKLIFLRKVGGGYIFVHRLIMEHFANLTEEDIERIVAPLERQQSTRGTNSA